jgi:hypothetical protein
MRVTITAGQEFLRADSGSSAFPSEEEILKRRLRRLAAVCIALAAALGGMIGYAVAQPIVCHPGPAGAIICTAPAVTPGTSSSAPSYVSIVNEPAAPPQLGPNQNALTYRAALADYCRRNLRGCGPGR